MGKKRRRKMTRFQKAYAYYKKLVLDEGVTDREALGEKLRPFVMDLRMAEYVRKALSELLSKCGQEFRRDKHGEIGSEGQVIPCDNLTDAQVDYIQGERDHHLAAELRTKVRFMHSQGRIGKCAEGLRQLALMDSREAERLAQEVGVSMDDGGESFPVI